jgi:hypothetical protein
MTTALRWEGHRLRMGLRAAPLLLLIAGCGEPTGWVGTGPHPTQSEDGGTPDAGSSLHDGGASADAGVDGGTPLDGGTQWGEGEELNPGWVGGACQSAADCNVADYTLAPQCLSSGFPNGMCTQACTQSGSGVWVCPDTQYGPGTKNTITRCIDAAGQPQCASECDFTQSSTGCRPGYACVKRHRYGAPDRTFSICLPAEGQRWPGEPAPPMDIGQPCSLHADCGHQTCLSFTGGYCSKSHCGYTGCPAGSSCFSVDGSSDTLCLKSCTSDLGCRSDYRCDPAYGVCLPRHQDTGWNASVGAPDCALAWGSGGSGLSPCDSTKDDYIVVRKSARNLALCSYGSLVTNFHMGLGFAPVGDKEKQGDGKTPEGVFYIPRLVPNSKFYKAFLISYPDKADAVRGLSAGLITQAQKTAIDQAQDGCTEPPQSTNLGGYLEVHGNGGKVDWTLGCVAVEDHEMDVLWGTIGVRDTVVIYP